MRGSAVLSLALLVALPSWAAAQVITLPSEPGFRVQGHAADGAGVAPDSPGDGGYRQVERFSRDGRPLPRVFHRDRPVPRPDRIDGIDFENGRPDVRVPAQQLLLPEREPGRSSSGGSAPTSTAANDSGGSLPSSLTATVEPLSNRPVVSDDLLALPE